MNIKKILVISIIGLLTSGSIRFILSKSSLINKGRDTFVLRDLKPNQSFQEILNEKDHDGSLTSPDLKFPKVKVDTNHIGASDTSSKLKLLNDSKCNILLMGSSTMQAAALPKKNRIETQVQKKTSCNVVNIASAGESIESSLLKYLTIKELDKFQLVFVMTGYVDSFVEDNPKKRKYYEPIVNNILLESFERRINKNKFLSNLINYKSNNNKSNLEEKINNNRVSKLNKDFDLYKNINRYENVLAAFKFLTDSREARLFLITSPYEPKDWVDISDGEKSSNQNSLHLFNAATRLVSKRMGIDLIDIDSIFNNSEKNLLYDSEHFNINGANILINIIKNIASEHISYK